MPATAITEVTAVGKYSTIGASLPMQAADVANGNKITAHEHALLVCHNTGGSARLVTVTSVAIPPTNRTGDVSISIPAGEYRVIELTKAGWENGSGEIVIQAAHAEVKFGCYVLHP